MTCILRSGASHKHESPLVSSKPRERLNNLGSRTLKYYEDEDARRVYESSEVFMMDGRRLTIQYAQGNRKMATAATVAIVIATATIAVAAPDPLTVTDLAVAAVTRVRDRVPALLAAIVAVAVRDRLLVVADRRRPATTAAVGRNHLCHLGAAPSVLVDVAHCRLVVVVPCPLDLAGRSRHEVVLIIRIGRWTTNESLTEIMSTPVRLHPHAHTLAHLNAHPR
ncbi:hypothetical protein DFQ27_008499 [Actinomortierella ambigua]|uniref:Uncharacterized protein n=1 Tax=Actinomortierella ambigua TaxID=1343610 RepID=A0A9P6PSX9_9FUNG|nr:hypothetical protein DFQ27_008499 [Actinomortierella ambigua]